MRILLSTCLASALLAGCGADPRYAYAEDSVRVSARALAEVQTQGGESATLEAPLARLAVRLEETERAVEVWRDQGGSLAFATRAPCLRAAIVLVRDTLIGAGLPVPSALDEADAMLTDVGGTCGPAEASGDSD